VPTSQKFEAFVEQGRGLVISDDDTRRWAVLMRALAGQRVFVTIEEWKRQRTLAQNAWYWGIVVPSMATEMTRQASEQDPGWNNGLPLSNEQCHVLLKRAFLGIVETPLGQTVKDSHTLSTAEFSEFCERIIAFAASEWGMVIPTPNENWMET
jgi:hypothetical protein